MSTDTFAVIVTAIVGVVFFGMLAHAIAQDYGRPAFTRWTRRHTQPTANPQRKQNNPHQTHE